MYRNREDGEPSTKPHPCDASDFLINAYELNTSVNSSLNYEAYQTFWLNMAAENVLSICCTSLRPPINCSCTLIYYHVIIIIKQSNV